MAWLKRHMNVWHGIEFVLLLVAIIGPWWFDRIVVPAQYPCSAPVVRLEGDFCGIPMSGTYMLWWSILTPFNIIAELVTGTAALVDRAREFAMVLFLLPTLPLISILLLMLARYRRRNQVFHIIALGLAIGLVLFANLLDLATYGLWALWGLWLYMGTVIGALLLELLTFNPPKAPISAPSPEVSSE